MSCVAFLDSLSDSTVKSRDGEKSIESDVILSSNGSKSSSVALEKEATDEKEEDSVLKGKVLKTEGELELKLDERFETKPNEQSSSKSTLDTILFTKRTKSRQSIGNGLSEVNEENKFISSTDNSEDRNDGNDEDAVDKKEMEMENEKYNGKGHEKNPSQRSGSPRFGKRFKFSKRYIKMQKLEAENETYYPPDHIRDGNLWSVKKELNGRERTALESLRWHIRPHLERFQNLTQYLDLSFQFKRYLSPEELNKLKSLKKEKKTRYRAQLSGQVQELQRKEDRARAKYRKRLLAKDVVWVDYELPMDYYLNHNKNNRHDNDNDHDNDHGNYENHENHEKSRKIRKCEGCTFSDSVFHYEIKSIEKHEMALMRKFIGNVEVEEIFTNDHGILK